MKKINIFLKFVLSFEKVQIQTTLLLSLFLICSFSYAAQSNSFSDEARAKYICSFIQQITWPGNATKLTMGVLESDTKLSSELRRQATSENLKDKSLTVISLKNLDDIPTLQVLYLNKNKNSGINIEKLTNIAKEKEFLLITEAAVFHQSMINFVALNKKTYYEVNEQALQKAGFTYMSTLPYGAIKNKEEWVALFKDLTELREEFEDLTQKIETAKQEMDQLKRMMSDDVSEIIALDNIIEDRMAEIDNLDAQAKAHLSNLWKRIIIIFLTTLLVLFLIGFGLYEYRNRKKKQQVNKILDKQNQQITDQRSKISKQEKEISDSIFSAQRIQKALQPKQDVLYNNVDMFVFNLPRDIVGGDFYWMTEKDNKLIVVAADCTGHGVPGAFMSMLGIAFLNEIVNKEEEVLANEILNKLRDNIIGSLSTLSVGEDSEEISVYDGIDIAICVIDYPNMTLQYSGAFNPLFLIRDNELTEIKADRMPVAYSDFSGKKAFTNILISLQPNDCIYIFSDGYADQFGGSEKETKKFTIKRLKNELLKVYHLPINEQEKTITKLHYNWKGNNSQTDDILLIGMKI